MQNKAKIAGAFLTLSIIAMMDVSSFINAAITDDKIDPGKKPLEASEQLSRDDLYQRFEKDVLEWTESRIDRKAMETVIRNATKECEKETGVNLKIPLMNALNLNSVTDIDYGKDQSILFGYRHNIPNEKCILIGSFKYIMYRKDFEKDVLKRGDILIKTQTYTGLFSKNGYENEVKEKKGGLTPEKERSLKIGKGYDKKNSTISVAYESMLLKTSPVNINNAIEGLVQKVMKGEKNPYVMVESEDGIKYRMEPGPIIGTQKGNPYYEGVQTIIPYDVFSKKNNE